MEIPAFIPQISYTYMLSKAQYYICQYEPCKITEKVEQSSFRIRNFKVELQPQIVRIWI